MIEVSNCVICEQPIKRLKKALVAPFVARRIWNREPFCVDLVECTNCGFMFYNPRLEDEELQREYAGWRSPDYLEMRHSFEPWYTAKFNQDLGSAELYESRQALLRPLLEKVTGGRKINRVLDYGGDHGDLIKGLFQNADLFLYDISGSTPLPGVTATKDPAGIKPDLIVNSNVLEHVGFPRVLVDQILAAAPDGGLMFVEVPCEIPLGLYRVSRRIAQVALMSVKRPALLRHILRPASLYMMHEHINYFTERSLVKLMQECGGNVIASGAYPYSGTAGTADMAWCLGQR